MYLNSSIPPAIAAQEKKDYAYALKLGTAAGGATAFSEDLASREKIEEVFAKF